jgi:glutamate-5-semialdehyde dehydrogenase
VLAVLTRSQKDAALHAMADALAAATDAVLAANAEDVDAAREAGTTESLVDRLCLNASRVDGMVSGLRSLAGLPDPVGDVVRGWTNANGVRVRQVRVPLGVVGIIYEARPNVTADAAGISLKSGNAALLRGSSSALHSNRAVVTALRAGLTASGLPEDAVQLVDDGGARPCGRADSARRRRPDQRCGRGVEGARDRDRHWQLPPLRRRQC